jgi:UDP-N-acetylmuramoylalanine--D-glutamate ligase
MHIKKNMRIGIWGYGIVGKAITKYFHNQEYYVSVMDKRQFTVDELSYFQQKKINYCSQEDKNRFFLSQDYLFSSPGINIANDYQTHRHKWLIELDIFQTLFNKPIIAVTGSIGKTSVTHMLASLLKHANITICVGGNIGTATFDLLSQKKFIDYALLEVSSFQLQYCQTFAPHLAIWTNLHPNHLDHHATELEYLLAKYNIMAHQNNAQHALVHLSLRNRIPYSNNQRSYFSQEKPHTALLTTLSDNECIYYINNNTIIKQNRHHATHIITLTNALMTFSFIENILLISAACDILSINQNILLELPYITQLPEHRLEKVATINTVDFYNDSKSTTTASTLAAIKKLQQRPLHLFLGGLSKGVDRAPFISQLKDTVQHIYCFGEEAEQLYAFCKQNSISAGYYNNLEEAFAACIQNIQNNDIVLFSPAGSSYDLYNNFEERGKHFKNLVKKRLA